MEQQRLMRAAVPLALILLILTGCAQHAPEPTASQLKTYSNDGLLGITDANPNLPLNSSYHTYAVDQQMVVSVLKQVPGIANARILFNGPHLNIYLKLPKGTTPQMAAQVQQAAFQAICLNMPRYQVNVFVGSSKLYERG